MWIGASDKLTEGDWKWVGGPEAGSFWKGDIDDLDVTITDQDDADYVGPIDDKFNAWKDGDEPNDASGEDYAVLNFSCGGTCDPASNWNDFANDKGSSVTSWLVEFGDPEEFTGGSATYTGVNIESDATITVSAAPVQSTSSNDDDDEVSPDTATPLSPAGGATRGLPAPRVSPGPGSGPRVLGRPVATPGTPGAIPSGPTARFGGIPSPAQITVVGGGIDVRAGGVNVGLRPGNASGAGLAANPESGDPELRVVSGQSTRLSGGGLAPGSLVQVWLPGVTNSELGRVPVGADGGFDGELSLSTRTGENPLPIGRRVMQVTGFDANGAEVVIEMAVNIAQPAPTPEANRAAGSLPDLGPSESIATSAGIPTPVTVTPLTRQRSVAIDGGDWVLNLVLNDSSGEVSGSENEAFIRMTQSSTSAVSGGGFQPSTVASVWMFSEPTLLGTVTVDEGGFFSLQILVDAQFIPSGEHTLQVQGVGSDGYIKAANLGVLVEEPVELTTSIAAGLLWWVAGGFLLLLLAVLFVIVARRRRA